MSQSLTPENVLDFPRPAICEPCHHRLVVVFAGQTIADTVSGYRVLERYHPPSYYFPVKDVVSQFLVVNPRRSICEWKGQATYFDMTVRSKRANMVAWTYRAPQHGFEAIKDMIAFYPEPMDLCSVDGVSVIPQPGSFFGGWLTANIEGPVKGAPATTHW